MLTVESVSSQTILELLLRVIHDLETNQATLDDAKTEVLRISQHVEEIVNNLEGEIDETIIEELQKLIDNGMIDRILREEVLLAVEMMTTDIAKIKLDINSNKADITKLENDMDIAKDDLTRIKNGIGNVKDYGAVGDGTTDDTRAFETAIANHHHVYVPSGKYLVQKIYMTYSVIIEGETSPYAWREQEQQGSVILVKKDASGDRGVGGFIVNSWGSTNQNSCTFRNLCFDAQETGYGTGIWGRWDCTIDTCLFRNLAYGVRDYHASRLTNCNFDKCDVGIYGITDAYITNTHISRCRVGIETYTNLGNYNLISDCRIEHCTEKGINLRQGVHNSILNCQIDRNPTGIYLENATNLLINGCHFDRSLDHHIAMQGVNIANISGCMFIKRNSEDGGNGSNVPAKAINLKSYENVLFSGCTTYGTMFDTSNQQYTNGYFIVEGCVSDNYNTYVSGGKTNPKIL